jgi:C-terminal processing protease CtpA/Prc
VPGVPDPTPTDTVNWGTITGTKIGYVRVITWTGDAGDRFTQAIQDLTQDPQHPTDGLIIDFRLNRGGNMFLSDAGLGMLFDRPTPTVGNAERSDPTDHFKMRMVTDTDNDFCGIHWHGATPALYIIDNCDRTIDPRSYNRPIAVLTGPAAESAGDQVALRMTYHPDARTFGEPTNGAFSSPCPLDVDPGWRIEYSCEDVFRVGDPHHYLTHSEIPIDQPVWLTPGDVAQGRDTVVDSALRWIANQTQ